MTDLSDVEGREYGPFPFVVSAEKVAEFVAATGDDRERWVTTAPPSFAASILFAAAPEFFADPEVASHTNVLVHVDQRFAWHGPLDVGTRLTITGALERVRERRGLYFVTFGVQATAADVGETGDAEAVQPLLISTSTFLMSGEQPAAESAEKTEPPLFAKGPNRRPESLELTDLRRALPELPKSASRADLVRYAGATLDFNPIHWDHGAARMAGLPGIVVHGLLMGAWVSQFACRFSTSPAPLDYLRLRFHSPLRPGVPATISGSVSDVAEDIAKVGVAVGTPSGESFSEHVSADARVRLR